MKIRVDKVENGFIDGFIEEGKPIEGRYYTLEDSTKATASQRKAFHSLIRHWWEWMYKTGGLEFEFNGTAYNFETPDWKSFRELWKSRYGAGYTELWYVDDLYGRKQADSYEDIPGYAIADFNAGNRGRIWKVLKSWSDYTIPEARKTIQAALDLIPCSECNDKKVMEIISGMKKTNEEPDSLKLNFETYNGVV